MKEDKIVNSGNSLSSRKNAEAETAPINSDGHKPGKKQHKLPGWVRIPLKTVVGILVAVILIPILLYIPPVQTFVKDLACKIVYNSTGMKIEVDRFRLKFPLDVSLLGVSVVEASGDTMVMAREAIADVKLLPLLGLDVKLNNLELNDGYYRMVSPDSSMIMKIRAHYLAVDSKSSMDIAKSRLIINEARLKDGDVSLFMDVWKQKPTPTDTTSTPFYIEARKLDVENIRFAMSMLPTIDSLTLETNHLTLTDGVIDLASNCISAGVAGIEGGKAVYIAPTPEYVAAHPAPGTPEYIKQHPEWVEEHKADQPSAPMTIRVNEINVQNFGALYTTKGTKPLPGFDPAYLEVSDVNLSLKDFYNRQTDLKLPLTSLSAKERSGLQIVEGSGLVALSEEGIQIGDLNIRTLYSKIFADAGVPFALMEMRPEAPVKADLNASLGMGDLRLLMPDFGEYIEKLPGLPLNAILSASGTLGDIDLNKLDVGMPGIFSVSGEGWAENTLDIKKLRASINVKGEVSNPSPLNKFMPQNSGFELPKLRLTGDLGARGGEYTAKLDLRTELGDLLADANIGLNSERYKADLKICDINVATFMPDLGVGRVDASLTASGQGFDPTKPTATTDILAYISRLDYNHQTLRDITLKGGLADGRFSLNLDSPNENLNLTASLAGRLAEDAYCVAGGIKAYNVDLKGLGLSETESYGRADIGIDVTARPQRWLYDADISVGSLFWNLPDIAVNISQPISLHFTSETDNVFCSLLAPGAAVDFEAYEGLESVIESFTKTSESISGQLKMQEIDMEELSASLPEFRLSANANGRGILRQFLEPSEVGIDTLAFNFRNDSILHGGLLARNITTSALDIDTVTLGLKERGKLMDYRLHVGNRPGTFDEIADVNLNGYVGANRLSAFLTQKNLQGQTGYRFGFTGALMDSTVSLHFTPLRATIAYLPWTFNDDNHIDYDLGELTLDANLKAQSKESSILLMTEPSPLGGNDLHLALDNIKIQDFLQMSILAPPVKATINSDIRVHYDGKSLSGHGNIAAFDLWYEKRRVGDLDLLLDASMDGDSCNAEIGLNVDGKKAISLTALLADENGGGLEPKEIDLNLTRFPLSIANPFLDKDMAQLRGYLNGSMQMTGSLKQPLLNGSLSCDTVGVYIPMMGSSLYFSSNPLVVDNNVVKFNDFSIYGANRNPLRINGDVDASKFTDVRFDLDARADNFQLIGNDARARSDIYGKLFLNLTAGVKGPMRHFDVQANLNILGTTNVTYVLPLDNNAIQTVGTSDVVKFVNFADTLQVVAADSIEPTTMAMRINAGVTITPGTEITVILSSNGTDKVQLHPSGTLSFFQNYMGDMTLNGPLYLGSGMARYSIPIVGTKQFSIDPQSHVTFTGDILNPTLAISATDQIKASVVNTSGNSSLVNFLVGLDATGSLSAPQVKFDLSTDDDLSLSNELKSMSADQRSTQAMNLLITGIYQGAGMKTTTAPLTGNLYGMLASELNSWAAKTIRGVDLSFGVDQYDRSVDGQNSTTTSYSYQVSKSLFNNKFKIVVGGNYSTDANADENFAENLVSDVSFEYMLKQTSNLSMLVRLFRHVGYESILEGEITEMGVGFTMRRRLSDLKRLFRVRWGKKKTSTNDSATRAGKDALIKKDEEEKSEKQPSGSTSGKEVKE